MNALTPDAIRATILDALCAIAPETDPATLAADKPLRDQVDLDSMDFLNVIVRLHEVFGIDIPESDYGQLGTLDAAVDYFARRSAAR